MFHKVCCLAVTRHRVFKHNLRQMATECSSQTRCIHFQYGSQSKCIDILLNLLKKLAKYWHLGDEASIDQSDIIASKVKFIITGLCEACAYILIPRMNIYNNAHYNSCGTCNVKNCNLSLVLSTRIMHPIVEYRNFAKLIFRSTDIWLYGIRNIMISMSEIEANDILLDSLIHIVGRIYLFKKHHWKMITFKLNVMMRIIKFVSKIIVYRISFHESSKYASSIPPASDMLLDACLVLLTKWLCFFAKYSKKPTKYKIKIQKIEKQMVQFKNELYRNLNILNHRRKSLKATKQNSHIFGHITVGHIERYIKTLNGKDYFIEYKHKELETKCQRIGCNQILKNSKFYICKKCHTACYCSRRCFKKDWNDKSSGHRNYCHKYWDMRNNKRNIQDLKKDISYHIDKPLIATPIIFNFKII